MMIKFIVIICFFMFFIFSTTYAIQNCLDFYYDHVNVENDPSLDMGTGGFTIEAWIKTSHIVTGSEWPQVVGKHTWGTRQGFALFIANTSNKIAFEVWIGNTWYGVWGEIINDGKWHHVVGRRAGNRLYVFKDGVQSGGWEQAGSNGNIYCGEPLLIGDQSWASNPFDGMIDEVRIWNCSLSNDEIQEMMFKELEGNETNLKAYYQFNETSGTLLPDLTANNNDGIVIGSPPWIASYAPIASQLLDSLSNIRGVWAAKNSHISSILTISDPNLSGNDRIIFGHNSDTLAFNSTNTPDNIINRLSRVWRIEKYGNLIGNMIFDCSDIMSDDTFVLIVDDDGDFSDAAIYEGIIDSVDFYVNNHTFMHSYYYTLGISLPSPENVIIYTQNDSVHVSWDGVTEASSYSIYSSTNPNEQSQNWTLEESGIADTTWTETASGEKKFYFVKAVN